jgi:hypothetical protein
MRWRATLIAAGALVAAAPAQAQPDPLGLSLASSVASSTEVYGNITGGLVVRFAGDAATGCANKGLCGSGGVIVWDAGQGDGATVTLSINKQLQGHSTRYSANLDVTGGRVSTSVVRSVPASSAGTCADVTDASSSTHRLATGRRIALRLFGSGSTILATRCAGPLDADLASVLPAPSLPVAAAIRGHRKIPLSGTWRFASGGFAGVVHSTLILHLQDTNTDTLPPPPKSTRGADRDVTEQLTLERVSGALTVSLAGAGDQDLCVTLDNCGLRGSLTFDPVPTSGSGELTAEGPARRPYRDFLAALGLSRRGNPRGIGTYGFITFDGGSLSADFGRCRDEMSPAPSQEILIVIRRRTASSALLTSPWQALRCGGPELAAGPYGVAGATTTVSGSVPTRTLAQRTFTMTLSARGHISDDGYTGGEHGSIGLLIRRGRITQQLVVNLPS